MITCTTCGQEYDETLGINCPKCTMRVGVVDIGSPASPASPASATPLLPHLRPPLHINQLSQRLGRLFKHLDMHTVGHIGVFAELILEITESPIIEFSTGLRERVGMASGACALVSLFPDMKEWLHDLRRLQRMPHLFVPSWTKCAFLTFLGSLALRVYVFAKLNEIHTSGPVEETLDYTRTLTPYAQDEMNRLMIMSFAANTGLVVGTLARSMSELIGSMPHTPDIRHAGGRHVAIDVLKRLRLFAAQEAFNREDFFLSCLDMRQPAMLVLSIWCAEYYARDTSAGFTARLFSLMRQIEIVIAQPAVLVMQTKRTPLYSISGEDQPVDMIDMLVFAWGILSLTVLLLACFITLARFYRESTRFSNLDMLLRSLQQHLQQIHALAASGQTTISAFYGTREQIEEAMDLIASCDRFRRLAHGARTTHNDLMKFLVAREFYQNRAGIRTTLSDRTAAGPHRAYRTYQSGFIVRNLFDHARFDARLTALIRIKSEYLRTQTATAHAIESEAGKLAHMAGEVRSVTEKFAEPDIRPPMDVERTPWNRFKAWTGINLTEGQRRLRLWSACEAAVEKLEAEHPPLALGPIPPGPAAGTTPLEAMRARIRRIEEYADTVSEALAARRTRFLGMPPAAETGDINFSEQDALLTASTDMLIGAGDDASHMMLVTMFEASVSGDDPAAYTRALDALDALGTRATNDNIMAWAGRYLA